MRNDQEWRQHLLDEIKELRNDVSVIKAEMITLKVKVTGFGSLVGAVVSYIINKFHQ
jgi:phosphotransferase system  glucose/maltose/N-acetylglucosamine-specific IIC component